MTTCPMRFQDYLEDLKSSMATSRQQSTLKFRTQCEKEGGEFLSEPRAALLADIEMFLRFAAGSTIETLQLSACLLIQQFLISSTKTKLVDQSVLEELMLALAGDKKKTVVLNAAQCIQFLQPERPLDECWRRAFEWARSQSLKYNSLCLVTFLLEKDPGAGAKLKENPGFINDLWAYVLDNKDLGQLGADCFVRIAALGQSSGAVQTILGGLQQGAAHAALSLTVLQRLFGQDQSPQLKVIISESYQALLSTLLTKPFRDVQLQIAVGQLMPLLAKFDKVKFEQFSDAAFDYLLERSDKMALLTTTAMLINETGSVTERHFSRLIQQVLASFQPPRKKQLEFPPDTLSCVGVLATAATQRLEPLIDDILRVIFSQGLSSDLVQALVTTQQALIKYSPQIEEKLYQLVEAELNGTNPQLLSPVLNLSASKLLNQTAHMPKTQLALDTLHKFGFTNQNMTNLCSDCLVKYLTNDDVGIRLLSAQSILKHMQQRNANYIVVNGVLSQVLVVGLTDLDTGVRERILQAVNETQRFDDFLAQKDNLDILFIGVNDSSFNVRQSVVSVIGRLSKIHPVLVLPHIREILIALLFELDQCQIVDTKYEIVSLLQIIVRYCSNLVQPFIKSVCKSIIAIADKEEKLQVACILALTELFAQCGRDLLEYYEQVINLIVQFLRDPLEIIKYYGLNCLVAVVTGTWLPAVPFAANPMLLDGLLLLIKQDPSQSIQKLAAKALVTIGAIDFNVKKIIQISHDALTKIAQLDIEKDFEHLRIFSTNKEIEESTIQSHGKASYDHNNQLLDREQIIKLEQKDTNFMKQIGLDYQLIVLQMLKNSLQQTNDSLYEESITCFRRIIHYIRDKQSTTSQQTHLEIEQIMTIIIDIIDRTSTISLQERYISEFIFIVSAITPTIKHYLDSALKLAYKLWEKEGLTQKIFSLLEEITIKFPGYDFQANAQIIQKLLQYYTIDSKELSPQRALTIIRSFNTLIVLLPSLKTQIKILLPSLLKLAASFAHSQKKELCVATLDCIGRICSNVQIDQIQSTLIQTLLKIMNESSELLRSQLQQAYQQQQNGIMQHYKLNPVGYKAFETLHYVAISLGSGFNIFVPVVNKVMVDQNYQSSIFNVIITLNIRHQEVSTKVLVQSIQQFKDSVSNQTESKLIKKYSQAPIKVEANEEFSWDLSPERLLDVILSKPLIQQYNESEPQPFECVGVDALKRPEQYQALEVMPKKDWICEDIQDPDQWRRWLQILQYSLIKHSPIEVIRYCYNLALMNQKIARDLFNSAYFAFSSDVNLPTEMRTTINSTLKLSLDNKIIPKDILQQILDLVEFLEHNGEILTNVLQDVKLGSISEACYAYARCLRYREQEYSQAPSSTMDILIRVNKKLDNHESSRGIIFAELQRLNQTGVLLLFEILTKRTKMIVDEINKIKPEFPLKYVKDVINNHLLQEIRSIAACATKPVKQSHDGSLGGIYVEGRPVFAGLKSKIIECDYSQTSDYLSHLLKQIIQNGTGVTSEVADQITNEIISVALQRLKEPFQTAYGPRPQWFEQLNWYEKALQGYDAQILALEQIFGNLDAARLKESLKTHQTLVMQKISCLYHLGSYQQVMQEADGYARFLKQFKDDSGLKMDRFLNAFNVNISKFCVQSSIELQDHDISTWLQSLDQGMSSQKLLIQSIHYVKLNQLEKADNIVQELVEQLISPIIAGTLESYERAYDNIISLQLAIELQEVIRLKKLKVSKQINSSLLDHASERIQMMQLKSIWVRRLAIMEQDVDTWIGVLRVRQLLIEKDEAIPVYLSFAVKCMQSGRLNLAKDTLEQLLKCRPEKNLVFSYNKLLKMYITNTTEIDLMIPRIESQKYEVVYTYCQYLFYESDPSSKIAAFVHMLRLAKELHSDSSSADLQVKVHVRLAEWYAELVSPIQKEAQMLQVNTSVNQQTEYHIIEKSAVDGLLHGLERYADNEDIESSTYSDKTSEMTTSKSYCGATVQELQAKIILDLVGQSGQGTIQLSVAEMVIPGYVNAKNALKWFEEAEAVQQDDIRVQRCISHTSSYIVELIDQSNTNTDEIKRLKQNYLIKSLQSHFRCMRYKDIRLPSALRLLTLWFTHGADPAVEHEFIRGLAALDIDVWIEVVPQLLARSTSSNKKVKYLIQQLLIQLGIKHPQLLVFPLMVATKRDQVNQQSEALSILDQIRRAHQTEVDKTVEIGNELTRIAITWPEQCMDGLFQAIYEYNSDKNQLKMLNTVALLAQEFEQQPETPSERGFIAQYYEAFKTGWNALKQAVVNSDHQMLETARSSFLDLHNKIKLDVQKQTIIELPSVSPLLANLRGSPVLLPGANNKQRIVQFIQKMNVIPSKQRPRKIAVAGDDGEIYAYLLKGREDLRQDERVMQLLGLIDQLLQSEPFAQRNQLRIARYPAVPIGKNTGLLFWVPRADTVNDLVKNYRLQRNFQENSEDRHLQQRAAQYQQLSLVQKLEAFRNVQQFCPALDLKNVFWEQASSSENWLCKRTVYTTSLAVMSIVGHVLGLGDRHPANLMVQRSSGQVVHIDYGDCFEACQRRAKLPERVPFRLTRMLVNAMEVCGVHGLYLKAAETTMRVLRNNKDGILAILQTFIHDPLIGWRAVAGSGMIDGVFDEADKLKSQGAAVVSPVDVVKRIEAKLVGRDFEGYDQLSCEEQVQALIKQATNLENLCQLYFGWCPLW